MIKQFSMKTKSPPAGPESEKFFARINASVTGFFSFFKGSLTAIAALAVCCVAIALIVLIIGSFSAGWMSLNNDIADKKSVETLNKDLADIRAALDMHVQQHAVQPAESTTPFIWRAVITNATQTARAPQ